jgi:hypothetical protein
MAQPRRRISGTRLVETGRSAGITGASPPQHLAVIRGAALWDEAAWLSQQQQPKTRRT